MFYMSTYIWKKKGVIANKNKCQRLKSQKLQASLRKLCCAAVKDYPILQKCMKL